MAVTHFEIDGKILCNTKGLFVTTDKDKVTCKKCIKKFPDPIATKEPRIVKRLLTPTEPIVYTESKKFGPCLSINNSVLLKLGDNPTDKVSKMVLVGSEGILIVNTRFVGGIEEIISPDSVKFLRDWFFDTRTSKGSYVTVSDVKEAFTPRKGE